MREIVASVIAGAGAQGVPPAPKYVPICWPVRAARDAGVLDDLDAVRMAPLETLLAP